MSRTPEEVLTEIDAIKAELTELRNEREQVFLAGFLAGSENVLNQLRISVDKWAAPDILRVPLAMWIERVRAQIRSIPREGEQPTATN